MLRKLMKYDLQSMARVLLPAWAGAVLLALLLAGMQVLLPPPQGPWQMTCSLFYGLAMLAVVAAVSVVTVVLNILRTYGMLGRSGYLMFSLPVGTGRLMLSRFLCAVGTTAVSLVLTVALLAAMTGTAPLAQMYADGGDVPILPFGETAPAFWGLMGLLAAILCFGYVLILACVAIGGQWPQRRLIATAISYLALSYGLGLTATLMIALLVSALQFSNAALLKDLSIWINSNIFAGVGLFAVGIALILAAAGGILWVIARRFLSKRLSLA